MNRTLSLALLLALSSSAHAGACTYSLGSYTNGFMPDFDQRRQPGPLFFDGMNFIPIPDGLPGNGANYCSPTSHVNIMGYLANHGFPALMPGGAATSWGSQTNYERATDAMQEMGVFMQTDPESGTTCCGFSGIVAYLDAHAPGKFIVSEQVADDFYAPTMGDIAFGAVIGGFVNIMVGWFENTGINTWQKTGGHVVTMVGLEGWCGAPPASRKIKIRDPGNDSSNLMAQSTFANNVYTLQQLPGFFDSNGTEGLPVYLQRTYERMLNYNTSDGRIGLINGYRAVLPKYGVTLTPPPSQSLQLLNPIRPTHSTVPAVQNIAIPELSRICWLEIAADGFSIYCTGADSAGTPDPRVFRVNRSTGEVETVYTGIAPTHIACGRGRDLYIADGPTLTKLDFGQSPTGFQVVTHGEEVDALAYDDTTDTLHALFVGTGSSNSIRSYMDIGASAWVHPIPTSVGINGTPYMAVSPLDGAIWIRSQNSPTMYRLVLDRVLGLVVDDTATIPSTVGDLGIDISVEQTREHILLARQTGTAAHYAKNTAGQWGPAPGSDFEGLPANGVLKLARSRTNFDPNTMDGPRNHEQLPGAFSPPEWDCPGDADENGEVGFSDITAVLTMWGSADTIPADTDSSGQVGFGDVTTVLTNWGPCP